MLGILSFVRFLMSKKAPRTGIPKTNKLPKTFYCTLDVHDAIFSYNRKNILFILVCTLIISHCILLVQALFFTNLTQNHENSKT